MSAPPAAAPASSMRSGSELITRFTNVTLVRNHKLVQDDLWLRGSRIIDPAERFWEAAGAGRAEAADRVVDGAGLVLAPGYIDLQLNGAFGFDFSTPKDMKPAPEGEEDNTQRICRGVLPHGVTSIYATVITSSPETYAQLRPLVKRREGSVRNGAHLLGVHMEGPFITVPGAHPQPLMRPPYGSTVAAATAAAAAAATKTTPAPGSCLAVPESSVPEQSPSPAPGVPSGSIDGLAEVCEVYGASAGGLDDVRIITLAPEIGGISEAIRALSSAPHNIVISAGHSKATYDQAVDAVRQGARLVTHLFNAMSSFHHRDPGIIGLIGAPEAVAPDHTLARLVDKQQQQQQEEKKKKQQQYQQTSVVSGSSRTPHVQAAALPRSLLSPCPPSLFYSLIVDGHHTHPASVKIAYHSHPAGAVLVTDAMLALGLSDGAYRFGNIELEVRGGTAHVAGTNTLAGSTASMQLCVQNFRQYTSCSLVEAVEAASLHPAQCMRLTSKGALDEGMDADLILLDPHTLTCKATWIMGELAWIDPQATQIKITEAQQASSSSTSSSR